MARTGRPPIPTEEKRRRGTLRPGRLPNGGELAAVVPLAAVPDKVPAIGTLGEVLDHAQPWLAATDVIAVALLRESLEERELLRGQVVAHPSRAGRKALRELDGQIVVQLTVLGLNPTARARLGLAEVKRASTLDRLKASRGTGA
jgi:hypothetical protein